MNLTSTHGALGRIDEAKDVVKEIHRIAPDFSIQEYMSGVSYRNSEDSLRVEDGLRKAGLPE